MQTIRDWAEFYKEKRLWVYPYNLDEKPWLYWKNIKSDTEYNLTSNQWNWDANIGIKIVVGKKGVRVIEVTNKQLLKKALQLLNLPEEYPWVIYSQSKYGIIIDTPGISIRTKGMTNRYFKHALLIWNGSYVIPSPGVPRYFYKNQIPQSHPKQIEDDVLMDCLNRLML